MLNRRHFLWLAAASPLTFGSSASAAKEPTPWFLPWADGSLSQNQLSEAQPLAGKIITCTNGHDVAVVINGRGESLELDWPVLAKVDHASQLLTGYLLPICCDTCGAVAIDYADTREGYTKWV
tara:strand:+ start:17436 stop:17804 length:369 start_codon:yes stop_codon:yes gene_type:complete